MSDSHTRAIATVERAEPRAMMHPLVQLATQGGAAPDPATLRELMVLQREWEAGEARKSFARAMVGLKRDLPASIMHDKQVDYAGKSGRVAYTHASHAKVVEDVTGILTAHGFTLTSRSATPNAQSVTVRSILRHCDGHEETVETTGPVDSSGGKNGIQGIASTITYLTRYQALQLLGIATRGMDEEPKHDRQPPRAPGPRTGGPTALARADLAACCTADDLAAWSARVQRSKYLTDADREALADDFAEAQERIEGAASKSAGPYDYGPPPMTDAEIEQ